MRRRLIVVLAVLVGCGLALFWGLHSGGPGASDDSTGAATVAREGPVRPPVPKGPDGAEAGSTPPLEQAPSESEGVLDVEVLAGGQPSPGANVRLYWHGEPGESAWRLAGSGVTDAKGHVRLASGPGSYLVAVRAPGQAPLLRDVVRPYGELRTALRVSLEPGQVLTGRTVVHGTNEPLPLVELVLTAHARDLEHWQRAEAPDEERVYATSDARGNFRVEGLAPGAYLLEARALGHARAVESRLRIPVKGPLTVALRVAGVIEGFVVDARGLPVADAEVQVGGSPAQVVTTGAEGGFSVEVEPGAHTVSARRGDESGALDKPVISTAGSTVRDVRIRLGPGAVLEGRVVEQSSGSPVVGARIDVSLSEGNGNSGLALSDAEGHFVVRGLAPGSYDAKVSAQGYSPTARHGLTVGQGERFPVDLVLSRTGAVEGQVRDSAGVPVVGARVSSVNRWIDDVESAPVEARTDATGHYRLEGLSTGRASLTARREDSTVGVRQLVDVGENGAARADFTLEGTGTVDGVVRAARGALPEGPMEVTALAEGTTPYGTPDVGRVGVGAEGGFRMSLPPGVYVLLLTASHRVSPGNYKQVHVEEGRTVHVELTWEDAQNENEYRGTVLEPDGAPSPGAVITLTAAEGRGIPLMMASADEEGRFAVPLSRVGPATRRVMLTARNGGRSSDTVPVIAEQEVVVKLRPAAALRGRVVRDGEPVKGFTLSLQLQKGYLPQGQGAWEFAGERFDLKDVPAEPVRLVARTPDGSSGEVLASPGMGAALEVEIPLKASATVRGRVVDATTKAPIRDAFIFIEGEPAMPEDTGVDAEGRFSISGVRVGERVLVAMGGPSQGRVRRVLKVKEGEVIDVGDLTLGAVSPPPGPPSP
ncbi:carboxypeptidase regulatory-like domain-containing protein [Corallococcus sp. CA053C]|uniref:carboxypeptidase regulatory-like domain-containing protein n=1 Tax=Corallococcus sp. CA053C TaxID=2316732 RepID=UPI000EA37AEE|nr:carboxypeptidase regulatory-like domain-containing protein [Corallococcus sp. CA053C]RKH15063.1 carboxypeptidase regulatory-like domain-containing protein [Corallococcus sp. CA053C]